MQKQVFIGIDLAWSQTSASAVAITFLENERFYLHKLAYPKSDEALFAFLKPYLKEKHIKVAVDAPLRINNEKGNREAEKAFLRDYAKYKLGVYPVNKELFRRFYSLEKIEKLFNFLQNNGLSYNTLEKKAFFEVYPHAFILRHNDYKLIAYKAKKGRTKQMRLEAFREYQLFLKAFIKHRVLEVRMQGFNLKRLKQYEDYLDAINCACIIKKLHFESSFFKQYGSTQEGAFFA